jgi:hypothetical protein
VRKLTEAGEENEQREDVVAGGSGVAGGGGGDPDQRRQARRGHRGGPGRHQRATGVQCPPRPRLLRRRQRQWPRPLHSRRWLIFGRSTAAWRRHKRTYYTGSSGHFVVSLFFIRHLEAPRFGFSLRVCVLYVLVV